MNESLTVTREVHIRNRNHGAKQFWSGVEPAIPVGKVPRISRVMALAIHCNDLIESGAITDQSELARFGQITTARSTQIMPCSHWPRTFRKTSCSCHAPRWAATPSRNTKSVQSPQRSTGVNSAACGPTCANALTRTGNSSSPDLSSKPTRLLNRKGLLIRERESSSPDFRWSESNPGIPEPPAEN